MAIRNCPRHRQAAIAATACSSGISLAPRRAGSGMRAAFTTRSQRRSHGSISFTFTVYGIGRRRSAPAWPPLPASPTSSRRAGCSNPRRSPCTNGESARYLWQSNARPCRTRHFSTPHRTRKPRRSGAWDLTLLPSSSRMASMPGLQRPATRGSSAPGSDSRMPRASSCSWDASTRSSGSIYSVTPCRAFAHRMSIW